MKAAECSTSDYEDEQELNEVEEFDEGAAADSLLDIKKSESKKKKAQRAIHKMKEVKAMSNIKAYHEFMKNIIPRMSERHWEIFGVSNFRNFVKLGPITIDRSTLSYLTRHYDEPSGRFLFPDSSNGNPRLYSFTRDWVCKHTGFRSSGVLPKANRAIKQSDCYHREGHNAPCSYEVNYFILLFGGFQIILSQIPDFHNMAWLSIMAAVMSFSYSFIGFGLGLAKVIVNGKIKGGIEGVLMASTAQKISRVSQGLGDIIFAFPYSILLLEIENTLKTPPPENQSMKKASRISISITTFFYLCCGCFGYAAFGDDTPGNLLTGFGFYEPYWLIEFANACIILHLLGAYQMFSQTVFATLDRWLVVKFPNSGFVNNFYAVQLPLLPSFRLNLLRLCYRTVYVVSTTIIATLFPYFNEVLGVLGAFNFWPIAIYFPVQMYFVQRNIGAWTRKWILLQIFCYVCLLVSTFSFVGSVEGLSSHKLS